MIDRIHCDTACHRAPTFESVDPSLTDDSILMLLIRDSANGGFAARVNQTLLAASQSQLCIAVSAGANNRCGGSSSANELSALPRLQLNVVHPCANWNLAER
jgi:hypothetical protein